MDLEEGWDWSFRTFLRVKPQLPGARDGANHDTDENESRVGAESGELQFHVTEEQDEAGAPVRRVELEVPLSAEPGLVHSNTTGFVPFSFNEVFGPEAGQGDVFGSVRGMIVDAFKGINCTVLAYGQTGTGKTFSISGGDTYAQRGLIPRGVKLVFEEAKARGLVVVAPPDSHDGADEGQTPSCALYVSFTEIYGEAIFDLLDPDKQNRPIEDWPRAQVLEGEDGLLIRGINVFQVQSAEDAMNLFFMGTTNRLTSSTVMNKASSRSHAVFTLVVETHHVEDDSHITRCGKINFVDLAGSERIYKETNSMEIIREGKNINLSLHFLEQVIISLRAAHRQRAAVQSKTKAESHAFHIPYRNCILTSVLRDSLGGNCRSCFLFTISMDIRQFEETVSTCRFAQRVGEVKVRVNANQEVDLYDQLRQQKKYITQLEEQVCELQAEAMHLKSELQELSSYSQLVEEKNRPDRRLSASEIKANKAVVSSILSGNMTVLGTPPPHVSKGSHSELVRSVSQVMPGEVNGISLSACVGEPVLADNSPPSPALSGNSFDITTLDRSGLVDLCSELAKSLAIVNAERKTAMTLQSQTSSSAAAFVAQRFASKARRQSFNTSQARSSSNISLSPGPSQAGYAVGSLSFNGQGPSPATGVAGEQSTAPTPPAHTPPDIQSNSPPLSDSRSRSMDAVPLNLQRDVDEEAGVAVSETVTPGAESRDRAQSDTSAASGFPPTVSAEVNINNTDQPGNIEDAIRKNDVFIDMLVFGDQFLKHSRRGVCGSSLRHISVSEDLQFLCRSHINNFKSMKMIPLTEIDRVEVGHGSPQVKNRESCLLTVICPSLTIDLECFCFDTFQENKVFAENWAMGLMYCIARAKGQIDEFGGDVVASSI